jgi:hypothetical protein
MLDALTDLEHLSFKLQDRKVTLPESHRLISHKYHVLQSMTQNPGEFCEEAQNAGNKLEFKGIKLEFGKVHKISQQDFFQKIIDNISICQSFSCVFRKLHFVEYGKMQSIDGN